MKSRLQTEMKNCYLCDGGGELHPHHIFNGGLRKKSEQYGYIVMVHNIPCHRLIHDNPNVARELKMKAQQDFEKDHTRDDFIKIFRKNYL